MGRCRSEPSSRLTYNGSNYLALKSDRKEEGSWWGNQEEKPALFGIEKEEGRDGIGVVSPSRWRRCHAIAASAAAPLVGFAFEIGYRYDLDHEIGSGSDIEMHP